jgi:hypothetical protein
VKDEFLPSATALDHLFWISPEGSPVVLGFVYIGRAEHQLFSMISKLLLLRQLSQHILDDRLGKWLL